MRKNILLIIVLFAFHSNYCNSQIKYDDIYVLNTENRKQINLGQFLENPEEVSQIISKDQKHIIKVETLKTDHFDEPIKIYKIPHKFAMVVNPDQTVALGISSKRFDLVIDNLGKISIGDHCSNIENLFSRQYNATKNRIQEKIQTVTIGLEYGSILLIQWDLDTNTVDHISIYNMI